jgi:DNA polymerase sigma
MTARWPDAQLQAEVFGSSFTEMHTSSSDIDIVLLDPALPLGNAQARDGARPEWHDVKVLAKYLRTHAGAEGFKEVHAIPSAAVPIVTFKIGNVPRLSGVKVDIAINNRFGIA